MAKSTKPAPIASPDGTFPDEVTAALAAPAIYANRFLINVERDGAARIALFDSRPQGASHLRGVYSCNVSDLVQMSAMLSDLLIRLGAVPSPTAGDDNAPTH